MELQPKWGFSGAHSAVDPWAERGEAAKEPRLYLVSTNLGKPPFQACTFTD